MRKLFLAASFLIGLTCAGSAQILQAIVADTHQAGTSYVGPGNTKSGAVQFWGVCAYTAAYAVAHSKLFQLTRASDAATTDILALSTGCADTAAIATFCAATTCTHTKWYSQIAAGDMVAGTAPAQVASCSGTLPCARFPSDTATALVATPSGGGTAQPFTIVEGFKRTGGALESIVTSNSCQLYTPFGSATADQLKYYAGNSVQTFTATDAAFHAVQIIFNGASSSATVDGSTTAAGADPGSPAPLIADLTIGWQTACGTNGTAMDFLFVGYWASAFSGGELTAMDATMHTIGQF